MRLRNQSNRVIAFLYNDRMFALKPEEETPSLVMNDRLIKLANEYKGDLIVLCENDNEYSSCEDLNKTIPFTFIRAV